MDKMVLVAGFWALPDGLEERVVGSLPCVLPLAPFTSHKHPHYRRLAKT